MSASPNLERLDAAIAETEAKLDDLDDEYSRLETLLSRLRRQRHKLLMRKEVASNG